MTSLSYQPWQIFFGVARTPFLLLTPVCVFLGLSLALYQGASIDWGNFVLVLIAATAAHISVNCFNEYFDFKSGLDFNTPRTPFSGGSGTLPANPQAESVAWFGAWISLMVTLVLGLFLCVFVDWRLLPMGLVGVGLILLYDRWIVNNVWASLVASGVAFGYLMVLGTELVLAGGLTAVSWWAASVPFLLVNNVLLLAQFPDVEADIETGRRNLPIMLGRKRAAWGVLVFLTGPYLVVLLGVFAGPLPATCLLALVGSFAALPAVFGTFQYAEQVARLKPFLGLNVLANLLTPVLLGVGLLLA